MSASERGRLIWKIADLIEENLEELAKLETLDNGKPLGRARRRRSAGRRSVPLHGGMGDEDRRQYDSDFGPGQISSLTPCANR